MFQFVLKLTPVDLWRARKDLITLTSPTAAKLGPSRPSLVVGATLDDTRGTSGHSYTSFLHSKYPLHHTAPPCTILLLPAPYFSSLHHAAPPSKFECCI